MQNSFTHFDSRPIIGWILFGMAYGLWLMAQAYYMFVIMYVHDEMSLFPIHSIHNMSLSTVYSNTIYSFTNEYFRHLISYDFRESKSTIQYRYPHNRTVRPTTDILWILDVWVIAPNWNQMYNIERNSWLTMPHNWRLSNATEWKWDYWALGKCTFVISKIVSVHFIIVFNVRYVYITDDAYLDISTCNFIHQRCRILFQFSIPFKLECRPKRVNTETKYSDCIVDLNASNESMIMIAMT